MKHFSDGKVRFVTYNAETEKKETLTMGNLIEDADVEAVSAVAKSLDTVVEGHIEHAEIVQSYHVPL